MTIALILLAIVGCVAVVLAIELTHLFGGDRHIADLPQLAEKLCDQDRYRPVERLFDDADERFLKTRRGSAEAVKRLRRSRAHVMRSYMRMLRSDFHEAWSVGRLLAPFSEDANFGVNLMKQLLTFYSLYGSIQVRMLTHAYQPGSIEVGQLVNALREARQTAFQTLTSVQDVAFQGSAA
jgi:hypothetical protein